MTFSSDNALQINQLPLSVDFPKEQDKFLEVLTSLYKRIANSVNNKEGGLYNLQELYNSQLFFTPNNTQSFRNVYRTVFDLVGLNGENIPGSATVTFPYNIVGAKYSANIYVSCTTTTGILFTVMGYPAAYLDTMKMTINFTNPSSSALVACYFIAEYLKN